MNKLLKKINKKDFAIYPIYIIFFGILTFFYIQKVSAFGCFDDCNNIMGGHFLLKNQQIFSDFFFNHAPLMAHLSFFIQKITHPEEIYNLILYHRLFLFAFSFLFGLFIIYRFKLLGLLFLIIFESTKYYIFGDRFLAESFIVYPVVYLFGIVIYKTEKLKINNYDYYLSGLFIWFICFMREPYIPLVALMFFLILIGKRSREKLIALLIFSLLTIATLFTLPLKEMFENVYLYNRGITNSEMTEKGGILKILFIAFIYPIYVFIIGNQTILKILEQIISLLFLATIVKAYLEKKYKLITVIIILLGVSNIRFTVPGEMFFGSFHMVIWFALLIFSTIYLSLTLKFNKNYKLLPFVILGMVVLISLTSKESFTNRNVNKYEEFSLNFNNYYTYGQAINYLSTPDQTIFLEERDDLIYWISGRNSAYRYGWYTSLMPQVPKYSESRIHMFSKNPPDFYYDACLLIQRKQKGPSGYKRINIYDKPSCLLIKNSVINDISDSKWESVKPLGFNKPL